MSAKADVSDDSGDAASDVRKYRRTIGRLQRNARLQGSRRLNVPALAASVVDLELLSSAPYLVASQTRAKSIATLLAVCDRG